MAATNATPYPIYGQAYRIPMAFKDTSGNLLVNWTGATAYAYPDNGTGVAVTIAESPVGSGYGYVDIPAAQMTCTMCGVVASVTNTNQTASVAAIQPLNLGQFTGRFDAQSVIRFEQLVQDLFILLGGNGAAQTGAALQMFNPDGSTHFSSVVTQNTMSGTREKMA